MSSLRGQWSALGGCGGRLRGLLWLTQSQCRQGFGQALTHLLPLGPHDLPDLRDVLEAGVRVTTEPREVVIASLASEVGAPDHLTWIALVLVANALHDDFCRRDRLRLPEGPSRM